MSNQSGQSGQSCVPASPVLNLNDVDLSWIRELTNILNNNPGAHIIVNTPKIDGAIEDIKCKIALLRPFTSNAELSRMRKFDIARLEQAFGLDNQRDDRGFNLTKIKNIAQHYINMYECALAALRPVIGPQLMPQPNIPAIKREQLDTFGLN